jgi:hypothetical protein
LPFIFSLLLNNSSCMNLLWLLIRNYSLNICKVVIIMGRNVSSILNYLIIVICLINLMNIFMTNNDWVSVSIILFICHYSSVEILIYYISFHIFCNRYFLNFSRYIRIGFLLILNYILLKLLIIFSLNFLFNFYDFFFFILKN